MNNCDSANFHIPNYKRVCMFLQPGYFTFLIFHFPPKMILVLLHHLQVAISQYKLKKFDLSLV